MEPQTQQPEVELHPIHQITRVSKYLAMTLFVILPFLGGYVGYTLAPEKVVEVEKVVFKEKAADDLNLKEEVYSSEVPEVTFTDTVEKGSLTYGFLPPIQSTEGTSVELYGFDTETNAKKDIGSYWFARDEKIASVDGSSFLVSEDTEGLQVVYLTESGLDIKTYTLPDNLTARMQFLCEMGCVQGFSWTVERSDNKLELVVDLYKKMTYQELVEQYQKVVPEANKTYSNRTEQSKLNFVQKYRIELGAAR